jgi:hypothetical protein
MTLRELVHGQTDLTQDPALGFLVSLRHVIEEEYKLGAEVDEVEAVMAALQLPLVQLDEVWGLGCLEQVTEAVEEVGISVETMRSSPHAAYFMDRLDQAQKKLRAFLELQELWRPLQESWLYARRTVDGLYHRLRQDQPEAVTVMDSAQNQLLHVVRPILEAPCIMRAANLDPMLLQLRAARGQIEVVTRHLADYSNQLRTTFSRFMWCTQDELCKLLLPSVDQEVLEENVARLFTGVDLVVLDGETIVGLGSSLDSAPARRADSLQRPSKERQPSKERRRTSKEATTEAPSSAGYPIGGSRAPP